MASHFLAQLDADYAPDFVPGIVDVVRALAGNCSLAVVSSNSTATIRRLLTRAGVAHCFSHVFGGDVEPDKRAVVRRFLADHPISSTATVRPPIAKEIIQRVRRRTISCWSPTRQAT